MYKLTIKNPDQYSGIELLYDNIFKAAEALQTIAEATEGNVLEYHIVNIVDGGGNQ